MQQACDRIAEQRHSAPAAAGRGALGPLIAAYREIEELVVNTDIAMIGLGHEKAVGLGSEKAHDDPLNGLIGGWPFLEEAWLDEGRRVIGTRPSPVALSLARSRV